MEEPPLISYHKFPLKDADLLQKWMDIIPPDLIGTVTKNSCICSCHFSLECLSTSPSMSGNVRNILRKDAVPTLFGPSECSASDLEVPNFSQKIYLPELKLENYTPNKKLINEDEDTLDELSRLKIKFLLAEEQRKDHLYRIELREKQELFNMEKKHRQEIYRKELEIKNLELMLLRQKTTNISKQF